MCWEEDLSVCTPALKNPVLSEVKAPERAETLHQETLGTPSLKGGEAWGERTAEKTMGAGSVVNGARWQDRLLGRFSPGQWHS